MTTKTPLYCCAGCGRAANAAAAASSNCGPTPEPGDIAVCFYCGYVSAYADDLKLRPLTAAELIKTSCDPDMIRMQRFVRERLRASGGGG